MNSTRGMNRPQDVLTTADRQIVSKMDPGTGSHLLDDVHVLLDQLFMPPANADLGGTDDQGGIG